jgi:N-acyl-phosphatidylethanolamine-hydrolysing phospholipase D
MARTASSARGKRGARSQRRPPARSARGPVGYLVAFLALLGATVAGAERVAAQAPIDGKRFRNLEGPGERGGLGVVLPFFARKVATSFFTREGAPQVPYDLQAIQHNPSITWIGHSTMLVRMDGVTFLTDPMFSERASPLSFAGPRRLVAPGVPLDALPPVDFATLSHDHYDHTDVASIRALAERGVRFVVPLGLGDVVREAGGEATELDWWDQVTIGSVRVHCVPVQHFSGRSLTGRNERLWAGWVVEGPERRFFHAGDTGYFKGFREIGARLGPIDLAAMPIGAYEPQAMMRYVHMGPEEALQAARDVGAHRVVAMHWGTFDLTDEAPTEPPIRFRTEAVRLGLDEDRAWVLKVGETRPF